MIDIKKVIKEHRGTIIDVRTVGEFMEESASDSINIPIGEIVERLEEVKNLEQPLILCCASGARSGQVMQYLTSLGIECCNAGSWEELKYYQSK